MTALMTQKQVADLLAIPEGTLPQWRYLGKGPRWARVGRHVRYRLVDVERWIDAQSSTAS